MYKEMVETNALLEKGYALFWDSLGQLDMASNELIGNIIEIENNLKIEMIELANKIRKARILFQEDSDQIPNWDKLRLEIQLLQNKVNKIGEHLK